MTSSEEISAEDLGFSTEASGGAALADFSTLGADDLSERERVLGALARARGVVAHAADELGVSRQALYRKMSRLGIELERRPKP